MAKAIDSPIGRELYTILTARREVSYRLEVAATDALWIWDLDDRSRRWVSARFLEALGYPEADVTPNFSWQDFTEEGDMQALAGDIDAHLAYPDVPIRRTVCMTHAQGYETAVEVIGIAIARDGGDRLDRLVGILQDQTRESHLEYLLQQTNSVARIGAWSVDLITNEVFWTPIVYEIHEVEPGDFTPTVESGVDFYREGYSRDRIQAVLAETIAKGGTWDEVLEIVTAKGNVRWVRAVGHSERRDGQAIRLLGSFQDIHEEKLREIEVARSEALLSNYFDLAPHGMIIAAPDGRIERVSQSFVEMLGYREELLLGRRFSALTHPDDRAVDQALLDQLRAGKRDSFRREKRYLKADGNIMWGDVAVSVIRDAGGVITNMSAQLVDITEVKAAEAYRIHVAFLEDKAREMEQFAYIASHDLRQPILTLHGYLDALREDYGERLDEGGREYLAIMGSAVARMDQMIRGLLDYTRLSKTRNLEEVDLAAVVAEVVEDLEGLRGQTDGTIEVGPLPTLRGHRVELRQVFQNIIANALKYHRPGYPPQVTVFGERVPDGYEFCVSDRGIGISPSDQARIFGLFQRVGTPNDDEGSGIGLASCRTIVERHGGQISVESTPGEGSTFKFTVLTANFV